LGTVLNIGQVGTSKFEVDVASLTKHAIILGATGSGKTVLSKVIVEEAALCGIPTFAIDPKGDIGNLAFKSSSFDFSKWSAKEADALKTDRAEYAQKLKKTYTEKAKEFSVSSSSASKFAKIKVRIFTPKSSSGLAVGISPDLAAPANFGQLLTEDVASAADLLDLTSFSLLRQVGYSENNRKEITFVSAVLEDAWKAGRNLTISELIRSIEAPSISSVGSLHVSDVLSEKERHALATKINLLISDPKLRSWSAAEPINFARLFSEPSVNILDLRNIQSEQEKQLFIEIVLQQLFQWLIKQGSAQTLRYLLYFDEIAGYCPPVREPPSKKLLLLLIKQARAFGLGLLLASQNAVDLDYKVISNANVRFVGRLGAQRDIQRVSVGLELDSYAEREISRLQPGEFYCNIFDPKFRGVIRSRWPLTYHRGPLENSEIVELMKEFKQEGVTEATSSPDKPEKIKETQASLTTTTAAEKDNYEEEAISELESTISKSVPQHAEEIAISNISIGGGNETFLLLSKKFEPANLASFIKLGNNLKSLKVLSIAAEEKLHPLFELNVSVFEKAYVKQSLDKIIELCELGEELVNLPEDHSATKSRVVPGSLRQEAEKWKGELSKRTLELKSELERNFDILLEEKRKENIAARSDKPKKKISDIDSKRAALEEAIDADEKSIADFDKLKKEAKKEKRNSKARVISIDNRIATKKQKIVGAKRKIAQMREDRLALEQEIRDIESDEKAKFHKAVSMVKTKSGWSVEGWLVETMYRARILVNNSKEHYGDVQWSAHSGQGTWGRCSTCSAALSEGNTCACGNLLCNSHLAYCKLCLEPACNEHRSLCHICNSIFCAKHSITCEICRSSACSSSHGGVCSVCSRRVCNDCSNKKGIIKREIICMNCSRR
jgi:DNA helicase HerA-like ATPase